MEIAKVWPGESSPSQVGRTNASPKGLRVVIVSNKAGEILGFGKSTLSALRPRFIQNSGPIYHRIMERITIFVDMNKGTRGLWEVADREFAYVLAERI